jgi:hypothetical protein
LPCLINYSAWAEIHDVFGDGHEYDWALEGDDEAEFNEEQLKPEMKYQDVWALFIVVVFLDRFVRSSNLLKYGHEC